jgi:chemotaxis regulatin CheY-phosphate phosphatase CheZ
MMMTKLYYICKYVIGKISNIFSKNVSDKIEECIPIIKKDFDIGEFNEWFCYKFENYDGRKGALGIFLRTDKLSSDWIEEYLETIGQETSFVNVQMYYIIVRNDWRDRLSKM